MQIHRIYSAFIKAVDRDIKKTSWGDIGKAGDLLHEFQSGSISNVFFFERSQTICLETAWLHDVAFSPSGDHLAWVSHNSIIFAVSSSDPSR